MVGDYVLQMAQDVKDEAERHWTSINNYNRNLDVVGRDEKKIVIDCHVESIMFTRGRLEAVIKDIMKESNAIAELLKELREEKRRSTEYEQKCEEDLYNLMKEAKKLEEKIEELNEIRIIWSDFDRVLVGKI
ncbi:unnamed protein product [Adineta steineri]|uniref:Uncharacterized protein n=1 Tax=Adineta steineri TaxID=433720 RepID=A0A815MDU8_9BILA|nr:unnamed protein product [Adineta steineri]CAF1167584.1 unnamed protein product [Adineta steineri]CAF1422915.1 unnamed protein product [Adineta steineri]